MGNRDANKNRSKYHWNKQFGEGQDISYKNTFTTWLHKAPNTGNIIAKKDCVTCFWCKNINGTHHTRVHNVQKHQKKKIVQFLQG